MTNYILQLRGFETKLSEDYELNPTDVSLYLALLFQWNRNYHKNPISISREQTMKISKIGSATTYTKCLHQLDKLGYIKYHPSKNKYLGSMVEILNLETKNEDHKTHMNTKKWTCAGQEVVSSINITKHEKQKQVKIDEHLFENIYNDISDDWLSSWYVFFRNKAKTFGNERFVIGENEKRIIISLLLYFTGEKEISEQLGFDLNKGIALVGPFGCGKTTIMRIFASEFKFVVKSAKEIVNECGKDGRIIIEKYSKGLIQDIKHSAYKQNDFCFDDLGAESSIKYYGDNINTMEEILSARYDLKHLKTYITTNLKPTELEAKYGPRLASRMSEMFNFVYFPDDSEDKRK